MRESSRGRKPLLVKVKVANVLIIIVDFDLGLTRLSSSPLEVDTVGLGRR